MGVHRTAGGGGVQDGAGLTRALQLMQGEAGGGGPTKTEVRQGEVTVCAARPALGPGAETGQGPRPAGEKKASQGLAPGRSLGASRPAEASTPGHDLQRSVAPAVGPEAAGWAGLSRGPRGEQAVRSRHAGRSPRSPCPAAPAAGPVAGGRPSACGGSPAIAPASQRRAWGDRGVGWWVLLHRGPAPPLGLLPAEPQPHLPLLRVQITAAHGDGEKARRAVWGAVTVQEASHIEAKVHGAGQVVRVRIHPPNDLSRTRRSS